MNNVMKCDFNGIPVEITRKKMKNMYIRIDDRTGIVKVSAPTRVTKGELTAFIDRNYDWIVATRDKVLASIDTKPCEYLNGETLTVFGQDYEIEFIPSYEDKGVYIKGDKIIILASLDSTVDDRAVLLNKWLRAELMEKIDELKPECIAVTGTHPKEWHIKDMKTRWGTCNYKEARIWISLNLVYKPVECLEYVMYHELTHLYVHNHGAEFKAYMDDFYPDWRRVRKLLNS